MRVTHIGRRVRGVVLTTEIVLLLAAIIMLAIVAFFGLAKVVLSQATSVKQNVVIVRAEAWALSGGGIAVTAYLQNIGGDAVYVLDGRVYHGWGVCGPRFGIGFWLNPGETKALSFVTTPWCSVSPGTVVYVEIVYDNPGRGYTYIGTAVRVAQP